MGSASYLTSLLTLPLDRDYRFHPFLGGWPTFALFYRNEKPAAPAFVIFEGWEFVLIDPGDLDGMRYDPV